jgi:hypothetical protein
LIERKNSPDWGVKREALTSISYRDPVRKIYGLCKTMFVTYKLFLTLGFFNSNYDTHNNGEIILIKGWLLKRDYHAVCSQIKHKTSKGLCKKNFTRSFKNRIRLKKVLFQRHKSRWSNGTKRYKKRQKI